MNNQYLKPAIATLLLAILFPIYWSSTIYLATFEDDIFKFIQDDMTTLTGNDLIFIIIGCLEVYVYLSLAQLLKSRLQSNSASILLIIMAFASGLYHATIFFDVFFSMTGGGLSNDAIEKVVSVGLFISVAALVVLTLAKLICSIVLLVNHRQIASLLKVFAVLLLLVSIFQLTFIFFSFNLLLFPCTLVLLAIYFMKEPESLEVI